MAQITINIPDGIATRVINAIAKKYYYSTTLENGDPNPETKQQFAKRTVIEFIKQAVKDVESEEARNVAAQTAAESVETDIVLS